MSRISRDELSSKMNDVFRSVVSFASIGNKSKIRDESFAMLEMAETLYKENRLSKNELVKVHSLHEELLDELESTSQKLYEFIQFAEKLNDESRRI